MPPAFVLSQDQTLHEMFFMYVQYLLIHSFASYLLALFFLSEKTELMFCPHEFVMLINHLVLFVFNCLIFKEPPSRDSYIRLSSFFLFVNTFFSTFWKSFFFFVESGVSRRELVYNNTLILLCQYLFLTYFETFCSSSLFLFSFIFKKKPRTFLLEASLSILATTYSPTKRICSTIGARGLNFCVRNGYRCVHSAIVTVLSWRNAPSKLNNSFQCKSYRSKSLD